MHLCGLASLLVTLDVDKLPKGVPDLNKISAVSHYVLLLSLCQSFRLKEAGPRIEPFVDFFHSSIVAELRHHPVNAPLARYAVFPIPGQALVMCDRDHPQLSAANEVDNSIRPSLG